MTPTQKDKNRIVFAIEQIAMKKGQLKAVQDLHEHFKHNRLTPGIKGAVIEQLNSIIIGEPRLDASTVFMSLMGYKTDKLVLTNYQINCFMKICQIVKLAKENDCCHKLVIVPFYHGGGFCPTYVLPELICHICGLNVTLPLHISSKKLLEQYGVDISAKLLSTLKSWCKWVDADKDTRVLSSREITRDIKSAVEKSTQFYGDLSTLKTADKKKFESWGDK